MKQIVVVYEIEDDEVLPNIPGANVVFSGVADGVRVTHKATKETAFIRHARWFNEDSSTSWTKSPFGEYNWLFLRQNQNWANDMLRARGYVFLNDIYSVLGMSRTAMGQIVGWVFKENESFIDFGCWAQEGNLPDDAILLDFNVQGPILHELK